ncbi:Uncharacterized protein Fot_20186 [Forsythia ovata]|uniref:Uncharacterized protein n=1 Tax=Forsythia ovata TaxID=205694 RepID=A0ABD1VN66_9LAMI
MHKNMQQQSKVTNNVQKKEMMDDGGKSSTKSKKKQALVYERRVACHELYLVHNALEIFIDLIGARTRTFKRNQQPVLDCCHKNLMAVNAKGHIAVDGAKRCGEETNPEKSYYETEAKIRGVDIDAADVNNDLAVVEYVEEIYSFYKLVEAPSVSTSGPSYSRSNLRLLLGVLGALLAPVHVSNNDPLP